VRAAPALAALRDKQPLAWRRLRFAHSDLSSYSVFEEAFTHGMRAAEGTALALVGR